MEKYYGSKFSPGLAQLGEHQSNKLFISCSNVDKRTAIMEASWGSMVRIHKSGL